MYSLVNKHFCTLIWIMMMCFLFLINKFHREVLISYKILLKYLFHTRWSGSSICYILVTEVIHVNNSGIYYFLQKHCFSDIDPCLYFSIAVLETKTKCSMSVILHWLPRLVSSAKLWFQSCKSSNQSKNEGLVNLLYSL